ncbi:NAD(P)H-quinone oxidoreductase subunit 4 [Dolichospermum sp. UHCC 0259]|uniref:NAD(P)H-quinone oxidoreductase subunit 4 n=1 Tax=Dolichospermum sp. UHCC 0259 TaxID=2590010 RepID=UPI00144680DE|nr:NAD(P)H-quinone oxidoreductase subunit 4 [Dolichospermum sp. UHCC 0259]MTJ50406.1 NAD(P)H-quinone oxidoreductase subunit 4 [Dolichospermum sp. UHCC 0259]
MNAIEIPWLSAIIFLPLVAALVIPLIPDKEGKTVRWYGLGVALLDFVLMIFALWQNYDFQSSALQMTESYPWIPQIGFNWSLGIDGLSMPLILLTGFINTLAVFAAWKVTNKPRLFYALMLIMYSAQLGVFLAQDLLMFFLMWEIELVPVYLLIAIWGGANRRYAATKFIIYTAAASIFILIAGFAMAFHGDNFTFNMTELGMKEYPKTLELALYAGFLIAYGVKLPIFPLHTWLPDAHGEASAPGSMILAGVLLKMGGYALIRFNVEMLTDAHVTFAPVLAILGVVNIVYGACCAFAQTNLKRRLAYSSIAHMGFVLIGIASYTEIGISGAVLQMVSHGLIAASLFFLSGVTYERTHTLIMDKMGGIAKVMPRTFALFTMGSMASLALPGMSGFVGELMVFLGFATSDVYSSSFKIVVIFLSAVGVILTPIYLLSMLRQVFYGNQHKDLHLDAVVLDIKPRELFITACLLVPIIGIGFYPKMITQTYDVKTVEVAAHARQVLPVVASQQPRNLYSQIFTSPTLASSTIVNIVE